METAKRLEREYERKAQENSWADPMSVTFEERDDGVFEVQAQAADGETYLLGFEDLRADMEITESVDQMLQDRGFNLDQIDESNRQHMRREMEHRYDSDRDMERGWQVLDCVERTAPGRRGYMHDHERLVFTGRTRGMGRGVPTGISPAMMDEHDKRRLRQKIETRGEETVAVMGKNCVVVDTRFDINGEAEHRLHGRTEVLNAPIEEMERMDINVEDTFVLDQSGAKALFISDGDYYYRGTVDDSPLHNSEQASGWIAALDKPATDIQQVLNERVRPDSVIAAEQADLDVKRQGDWFFVEQHDDFMPTGIVRTPELQPEGECDFLQNHAAEWLGMDALNPSRVFVKGEVTHLNDDHEVMDLGDSWCTAIHNGVESRSFECEEFDAEVQDRGMYSHPESHGGLL